MLPGGNVDQAHIILEEYCNIFESLYGIKLALKLWMIGVCSSLVSGVPRHAPRSSPW